MVQGWSAMQRKVEGGVRGRAQCIAVYIRVDRRAQCDDDDDDVVLAAALLVLASNSSPLSALLPCHEP